MSDDLIATAEDLFPVLARQHRRRLSEAIQVRTRLVASKALPKAYAGPGGRTHLTADSVSVITLAMAATDKAVHAPLAVETYPFLEAGPIEPWPVSRAEKPGTPAPFALWLRDEPHDLFMAVTKLFVAAAEGELQQHHLVRLEVNRARPVAELLFRDERSGVGFRRPYIPPMRSNPLGYLVPMPDYYDTSIGTSLAYRLHREYFIAVGSQLRKHQEKAAAEPRPGRRRQVDRDAPANDPHGRENKLAPPDGQPVDLPHPERLVQQDHAPCRRASASPRHPVV